MNKDLYIRRIASSTFLTYLLTFLLLPALCLTGFEKLDFSLCPGREYQLQWLRYFLEYNYEQTGRSPSRIRDVDVERLYVEVKKFTLVR